MVPIVLAPLAAGCASIRTSDLVPKLDAKPKAQINASVKVAEVVGVEKTSGFAGPQYISTSEFSKALVSTLRKSHVFKAVRTGQADLYLHVRILSQDQTGFIPYTASILVSYKLTTHDGKVVWTKPYDFSQSRSSAFSGATRTTRAREGCVRKNLAELIQAVEQSAAKISDHK